MNRRGFLGNIIKSAAVIALGFAAKSATLLLTNNFTNIRNGKGIFVTPYEYFRSLKPVTTKPETPVPAVDFYDYDPSMEILHKTEQGYITISGLVKDVDTATWSEGESLWTDQPIPGDWSNVRPIPSEATFTGTVVESHNTLGSIFVAPHRQLAEFITEP